VKPLVTILIPAYNDESTIGAVLESVRNLSYEPVEVVVINDASTDSTGTVVAQYPVRQIINDRNRGLGHNLNLGLSNAAGDYLVVLQSDCRIMQRDWIDMLLSAMDETTAVVVSQREVPPLKTLPAGARLFNAVAPQDLRNQDSAPKELLYCRGKADLYKLNVLKELGGWNRDFFTAGEDTDLSIRLREAGYKILLHPEARIEYLFSGRQTSVTGALQKAILYGKTAFKLYRLHRYDGIQARTYLVVFLSALLLILPIPARWPGGFILLFFSFTCRIQYGKSKSISFGLLALVASLSLLVLQLRLPLIRFSSILPLGMTGAGFAYTVYVSAKNTARNIKKGESLGQVPGAFVLSVIWRLASGLGYLAGTVEHHLGKGAWSAAQSGRTRTETR